MLTRILVAAVGAPILFVLLFFAPPVCTAVMVSGIVGLASFELLRCSKVAHHNGMYAYTAVAAAAIPIGGYLTTTVWNVSALTPVMLCALVLMCLLFASSIRRFGGNDPIPLEHLMVCFFGGAAIPAFLSALVYLRTMDAGRYLVLLPVICAFLTDSGAYFAGVFLGKHKGIIRVSPNKSLEGYVGGMVSGGIFMLIYGLILNHFTVLSPSLPILTVYGLIGSGVTELGDLSFSLIKRQYGVKDYGNLLPGHGGMLDRFDSMIFAAPTLWLLATVIPAF